MYSEIKKIVHDYFDDSKNSDENQCNEANVIEPKEENARVKHRLDVRHKSFIRVFQNNLIVSMLCNRNKKIEDISQNDEMENIYRLSAIDLFVEKAIVILENEANSYQLWGKLAILFGLIPIVFGIWIAGSSQFSLSLSGIEPKYIEHNNTAMFETYTKIAPNMLLDNNHSANQVFVLSVMDKEIENSWREELVAFVKSFTFYGLLVLMSVLLMRFGKSLIDQAERLFNRRHALREGRLYLHLKNGYVQTVEEFDQVFNWNTSQDNAFATIPTDAQAPWGTALKEALNIIPKTVEAAKSK
ncbi:MAG: hypothetical protein PHW18_12115 [Sulfuricurvum sp.]|uniref:hypothetical protein n=1 Tax=Sulfuricurvum sp. TaxID=2025608 RepID=UPI002601FCE5|nr:hypothetical protein [Sulfuricurvum sp.]MDD2830310.1 hypothetical protein [Sulfuricurvum sp.]MDD4949180.1 hypothetical protein [Sulfuricurvum sp.]